MRRGKRLPTILIALGLSAALTACSAAGPERPMLPAPPVAVGTVECPAPKRPDVPAVNRNLSFDHPDNVAVLMARDDVLRRYVKALQSSLRCYEAQARAYGD